MNSGHTTFYSRHICKYITVSLLGENTPAVVFVLGLVISTIIIFIVSKLFGESRNLGKAFITAVIGSLVWVIISYFFGHGLLATVVAGVAWLFALKIIYELTWTRAAIIAVIIWIVSYFISVGLRLPTAPGPL